MNVYILTEYESTQKRIVYYFNSLVYFYDCIQFRYIWTHVWVIHIFLLWEKVGYVLLIQLPSWTNWDPQWDTFFFLVGES